jgi:hypothetical protein
MRLIERSVSDTNTGDGIRVSNDCAVVDKSCDGSGNDGKGFHGGLSTERPVGGSTCAAPQEIGCP